VATLALAGFAAYLGLAFGLRTAIHMRETGSSGFKGLGGRPGSVEWLAGVLFGVALVAAAAAPLLTAAGAVAPIASLDEEAVNVAGVVLFVIGLAGTLVAQLAMGSSWRIGVDATERTELVVGGPFRLVRNPIFSAMLPASAGLALMVPSPVALAALVALFVALELQVRLVEEPYLLRTHGDGYASYAATVGRFLPAVGRLEPSPTHE
jgi:protein-S-isoprenylcysteine O-methyltransferase Ste14